jgi:predicted RNA binding protein YcfA (HicA-like mRNA interferase family)
VSPALPVVSGQEVVTALGKIGFEQVGQRGSHVKLRDQEDRTVIVRLIGNSLEGHSRQFFDSPGLQ